MVAAACIALAVTGSAQELANKRVPWTTSKITGTPDPPLPYTVEPYATGVTWKRPIYAVAEPGTRCLLVIEQGGEPDRPSRVLRWDESQPDVPPATVLEMPERLIYSVTFHPGYQENGLLYVFSNGPTGKPERTNVVSRFVVGREDPKVCDMSSELKVIQWRSMGHDGGDLLFGNDGMLYIASGDGTSDSDLWVSAQDISNLLGAILRIDVDHPADNQAYSIPGDNPFLSVTGARGEIWAFGLRNPWRMSVDRPSSQIWVGNNGQDLWETVHLVQRGDNYGWSVYEGNHPFYLHRQLGPAPFVPPTLEHHHREARSLTGGVTYRGEQLTDLDGVYCYGDYATGKIWGARHDGQRVRWHQELADTALQIAGFAVSPRGELLVVDHGSGLYRIIRRPESEPLAPFPQRLSDTGIFRDVAQHEVQPGVIAYSVNASAWNDGAAAQRFLGLPGESTLQYSGSGGWNAPDGTVLVQTLSLPLANSNPSDTKSKTGSSPAGAYRRIETRILTRHQGEWAGYSYRWNASQDDAELVPRDGAETTLQVVGSDGASQQHVWRFPSRAQCMSCHSRAANYLLGITSLQLNRPHTYDDGTEEQLLRWDRLGLFTSSLPEDALNKERLVDPYDTAQPIGARARAYLHVNCSGCHVEAGGGNARIRLDHAATDEQTKLLDVLPQHANFGIDNARLIARGAPDRSILLQRVARRGPGQMPPVGTHVVDEHGVELLRAWIVQMQAAQSPQYAWTFEELSGDLDTRMAEASSERGRAVFEQAQCAQCHRVGQFGGGAGPNLTGLSQRMSAPDVLRATLDPSQRISPEFAATVIHTTDGRTIEGRIESASPQRLVVRPAGALDQPVEIPREQIEEQYPSPRSTMPSGLLNRLERAQVYDLLAFLMASVEGTAE